MLKDEFFSGILVTSQLPFLKLESTIFSKFNRDLTISKYQEATFKNAKSFRHYLQIISGEGKGWDTEYKSLFYRDTGL